jgi:hypothetical protein
MGLRGPHPQVCRLSAPAPFCNIALHGDAPDEPTVRKMTRRLGPEVVDELIRSLIKKATSERRLRPRAMRCDSTVLEADIRFPNLHRPRRGRGQDAGPSRRHRGGDGPRRDRQGAQIPKLRTQGSSDSLCGIRLAKAVASCSPHLDDEHRVPVTIVPAGGVWARREWGYRRGARDDHADRRRQSTLLSRCSSVRCTDA